MRDRGKSAVHPEEEGVKVFLTNKELMELAAATNVDFAKFMGAAGKQSAATLFVIALRFRHNLFIWRGKTIETYHVIQQLFLHRVFFLKK